MRRLHLKFSFVLVAIISLFVCDGSYGNENKALELGVKKTSIGYQSDVISTFIENSIPFYIDSEGILKYPGEYEEKAANLLEKLNSRPEMQFNDYKYASLFITLLKKNNINFVVRHGNNKMDIHIVYQEKDKKIVDDVIYPEFVKSVEEGSKTGVYGSQQYPPNARE